MVLTNITFVPTDQEIEITCEVLNEALSEPIRNTVVIDVKSVDITTTKVVVEIINEEIFEYDNDNMDKNATDNEDYNQNYETHLTIATAKHSAVNEEVEEQIEIKEGVKEQILKIVDNINKTLASEDVESVTPHSSSEKPQLVKSIEKITEVNQSNGNDKYDDNK